MATARKLPSGNWRVRLYVGTVDGVKQYKSFTDTTKKGAESKALAYVNLASSDDLTFGEACRRYIKVKENIFSPATVRQYTSIADNYLGFLANIKLSVLKNDQLQAQLNDLSVDRSPKTINNIKCFFTAVLGMYPATFIPKLQTPPKEKKEVHIPTDDDIKLMLETAKGTDMELPIKLAAFGSLRRSEVSAIYKDSVFEDHIEVRRDMVMASSGFVIKNRPKTFAGYRSIYLPTDVMQQILALADATPDDTPVISLNPRQIYDKFRQITRKAGVYPFKYHSLRHYFASYCHSIGIPDQYIMKMGGWDDISTLTKIYQHTMDDRMEDARKQMLDYYKKLGV